MKIGDFEIAPGAYLAPMAGVTDVVFRNICKRYQAAMTCTEMVSVQGLFYQPKKSLEIMRKEDGDGPHIIQVFGADPKMMAEMVKKNCSDFDIIDINMGCPAPKIVKGGAGSALMKTPQLAFDIVKAMTDLIDKPISCKIRSGWDEENINAMKFAKGLQKAGASLISIHARTRGQYYSGKADWDLIKSVKESISIPLIGNGDINSAQDAKKMLDYTKCDLVMVGRAAQGKPYIFKQIKDYLTNGIETEKPSLVERMEVVYEHAEGLTKIFGEKNTARMMRKHLAWYIKGEKNAAYIRNQAVKVNSLDEIKEFINTVICNSSINT